MGIFLGNLYLDPMPIQASDIDVRQVKDAWIRKSAEYALLSWTAHFNRMGKASPYSRMEKILLGKIAELSFFELLEDNQIAFDLLGQTKWYQIDQYDAAINGVSIDIKSNFIDMSKDYFLKRSPSKIENKLNWLLKFQSLVPADQLASSRRSLAGKAKCFVFSYIEGSFGAKKKHITVHAFWDYLWLKKGEQKDSPSVGHLDLEYNGELPAAITLYGTSAKNVSLIEHIDLGKKVKSKEKFHQLFSIKFKNGFPSGTLTIRSRALGIVETILPKVAFSIKKIDGESVIESNQWSQLWLNDATVFTTGYIHEEEFKIISEFFPRYSKNIEQYQDTLADNYGCPVKSLEPITNLQSL